MGDLMCEMDPTRGNNLILSPLAHKLFYNTDNCAFSSRSPVFTHKTHPKKSNLRQTQSKQKTVSFADSCGFNLHHIKLFDKFEDKFSQVLQDLTALDWEYGILNLGDLSPKFSPTSSYHKETSRSYHKSRNFGNFGLIDLKTRGFIPSSQSPSPKPRPKRNPVYPKNEEKSLQSVKIPSTHRCERLFELPNLQFNASCHYFCDHHRVKLESVTSESTYSISGTILVRNICFQKQIKVRVTGNHWNTFQEFPAHYLNAKCEHTDRFGFNIDLKAFCERNGTPVSTLNIPPVLEMCVHYIPGNCGTEFWDNNNSQNYKLYKVAI